MIFNATRSLYNFMSALYRDACDIASLCNRLVFERAIQQSLSARKMKFFFKRYLDFEQEWGTEATVEAVRKKAEEFVDRESTQFDNL